MIRTTVWPDRCGVTTPIGPWHSPRGFVAAPSASTRATQWTRLRPSAASKPAATAESSDPKGSTATSRRNRSRSPRAARELAGLARDVHRDVPDRDAGPSRDAFACRQLHGGPAVGAGRPADLGNPDHPSVRVASDVDVDALADHRTLHAGSVPLPAGHAQRLAAKQSGLNGHGCFPEWRTNRGQD